ncbi:BTB domain containing protein [Pyrenophora tritici-repentis]|uniref:BTB domain-containing protein n=2 Tax=Pyrenophora tritici-repentis TaxID=45151 RepID=B2W598_PYRTR|nr:uncharacterized protein PTRG_04798 [Pyrenophora tritici-repentis Pt-1C-BFP]EDU47705.1 predicted protein [Pyrenophora tritici-repentis Pt-1C-BFP]KAI1668384.1 BTB domain containing protein [Pyrenophora tritici-repentis]KAI1680866.1 BTB domain containing protein [Pyrenophora tritici-repentis]
MPPITVPCCAPYVPPVFTTNSKDVIFKVGHGSECKEFEVEAALVRACPGCFRDWLKKNQKNPNKEMALPDEKPAVFSVFVAFLKTGTIVIPSDDHDTKDDTDEGRSEDIDKDMNDDVYEERNSDTDDPHTNTYIDEGTQTPAIHMLIPLFTFAKDHVILPLHNAILSTIITTTSITPLHTMYAFNRPAYDATSHPSPLRDLLICTILAIGSASEMQTRLDIVPKEFLADCLGLAAEVEGVPFQEGGRLGKQGWLADKAERVCAQYHDHHDRDSDTDTDDGRSGRRHSPNPRVWQRFLGRASMRRGKGWRNGPRPGSGMVGGRGGYGRGGGRGKSEEDEWSLSDEVEDKEDDEGVREMKRLFQEESDARMRDLLKPLPPRERY